MKDMSDMLEDVGSGSNNPALLDTRQSMIYSLLTPEQLTRIIIRFNNNTWTHSRDLVLKSIPSVSF